MPAPLQGLVAVSGVTIRIVGDTYSFRAGLQDVSRHEREEKWRQAAKQRYFDMACREGRNEA